MSYNTEVTLHVYESIDDLAISLAHANSHTTDSVNKVSCEEVEDPNVSLPQVEYRNRSAPEADPVGDPMERRIQVNGNLMLDGGRDVNHAGSGEQESEISQYDHLNYGHKLEQTIAANRKTGGGLCQDPHYEHLNNPKFEVEDDSARSHTLLQQSSDQEPAVTEKVPGCESTPILVQAVVEYHRRPEEEMANSLATTLLDRQDSNSEVLPGSGDEVIRDREMSQDQGIHENSTNEGGCETISGYERVRYSLRLEQVLLEISRRRDREKGMNESASCVSTHVGQGGSDTNLKCKRINFDSWMEQALLEYQRRNRISDAVTTQQHKAAAPTQTDSDQDSRNGTNQEYERVIYDPRLERALLEYQRRAEEGRESDPMHLRQLLDPSQASGYETISWYERVQYDPRLEQVLLEISQRRPRDRNISKSVSCATADCSQESSKINLGWDCDCIYDSWMEQEYQKTAREFESLAPQEGEYVGGGQNRKTNEGHEPVNYDPRQEQAWMRAQRGSHEIGEVQANHDGPDQGAAVMPPASQRAQSSSSRLDEPYNRQEHVYDVISGYERVNYDPRLIHALLQSGHASRQGTCAIIL